MSRAGKAALAAAAASSLGTLFACAHHGPSPQAEAASVQSPPAASAQPQPAGLASSQPAAAVRTLPGEAVLDHRPAIAPLPPFDAPVPQQLALPNGLRVLLMRRPGAPIQAVQLVHGRGGSADPAGMAGLASLTAAMLEAGSAGKTQTQIAQAADALGATLHAYASEDATVVSVSGLSARTGEMVALLADVALRPNFDEGEWARVKAQRFAGLRSQRSEPRAAASLAFAAAVYGQNPLSRPVSGTPESVARIELADAKRFFAGFVPGESALAVSGSLSAEEVMPLLAAAFEGYRGRALVHAAKPGTQAVEPPPAAEPAPPPPPRAAARPRLVVVDYPGKPQSVLQVGLPSVPRSSRDVLALRLLNSILGGSFTSRLNQNLREQHGYTYGAGSSFAFGRGPGPFVAGTSVKTEVTGAALKELLGEIRRALDEPLSPPEIQKGKALLAFDLVATLEHADAAAGGAASIFLYELPLDEFRTFVPRLDALDAAQVQAAARKAVDPSALTVVIAGDAEKVLPQLEAAGLKLGPPELRDPDGKLLAKARAPTRSARR
jgi:predicted Zn-dependent peptidase